MSEIKSKRSFFCVNVGEIECVRAALACWSLSLLNSPLKVTISDQHWWYYFCVSLWSLVPWPLLSASVMQMLKSLTSPWKLSAELYAKVLQSPHEGICVHSVLPVYVCLCTCIERKCICVRKRGGGRKRRGKAGFSFLFHHYATTINPSAFCIDGASPAFEHQCVNPGSVLHTDRMQLPAIVCFRHMLWQTAGHAFLSHYDLCPLLLQHDWKAPWPWHMSRISHSHISL